MICMKIKDSVIPQTSTGSMPAEHQSVLRPIQKCDNQAGNLLIYLARIALYKLFCIYTLNNIIVKILEGYNSNEIFRLYLE